MKALTMRALGKAPRILAAVVLVQLALGSGAAWALPSGQTGSGKTSLLMKLAAGGEYGGTEAEGEYANPDEDGDELGDNLAFSVPVKIDFIAMADGSLVGPSSSLTFIENESRYGVRVSSMQVEPASPWKFVDNAMASAESNVIDLQMGPEGNQVNASKYLSKAPLDANSAWTMTSAKTEGVSDRVNLVFSGHLNNVNLDLRSATTFGQINWFVSAGSGSN